LAALKKGAAKEKHGVYVVGLDFIQPLHIVPSSLLKRLFSAESSFGCPEKRAVKRNYGLYIVVVRSTTTIYSTLLSTEQAFFR
jgi:hypothetical protein